MRNHAAQPRGRTVRIGLIAALLSLVVHGCALAAAAVTWLGPPEEFRLAGRRNVVQIEMAWAPASAPPPVEISPPEPPSIELVLDEPPSPSAASPSAPALSSAEPMPPMQPAETKVERTNPPLLESVPRTFPARQVPETRTTANTDRPRVPHAPDRPPEPRRAIRRLERRRPTARPPQPQVTVPQIAGSDDRAKPDLTGNPPPPYPVEAIRRRLEGTVLLRLSITPSGRVESVSVTRSSGHVILDQAAVNAVRSWRGQPARRGGRAVASDEVLPIRFRL